MRVMFSLMANCFQWMTKRREPFKKVTLVLIGLDNAGKTTTILGIQGECQEDVAPTVGFSSTNFKFERFDVTTYDLGGGKRIRPIWKNYYAEIHGVVFVLDASDESRLRECQEVLQEVLKQERVSGKRILILANKQDKEGALDEIDICDQLNLEDMVNDSQCPCRVETCSATQGVGKKMDKSVSVGLEWLLHGILRDWPTLSARVARETEEQKEAEAIERKAKLERIRKRKEERERKEEEERIRLGEDAPPEDEEDDVITEDPFKPVTKEYLEEKTEKSKKAKALEKKRKLALENLQNGQPTATAAEASIEMERPDPEPTAVDSRLSQNATESAEAETRLSENLDDTERRNSEGEGERVFEEGVQTPSSPVEGEANGISPQEIPEKKKKKKKKKLKKSNKLHPEPFDGPVEGAVGPLAIPSWASTTSQQPLTRPHQHTLDPLPEGIGPRLSPLEMKMPLNNSKLEGVLSRRSQPNLDQEDDVLT